MDLWRKCELAANWPSPGGAKVGGQMAVNLAVNFLLGKYGLMEKIRVGGQLAVTRRGQKLAATWPAAGWIKQEIRCARLRCVALRCAVGVWFRAQSILGEPGV